VIIAVDAWTGYHLQSSHATKYNRGADYLVLIAWPLLARAASRRDRAGVCLLALSAACVLSLGPSATGRLAALVGAAVLGASWLSRRMTWRCLAAGTAALAGLTPFLLGVVAEHRSFIASHLLLTPHLHASGLHRLEIWDYMSARVLERPILGWGLWSSTAVPIRPDELARYVYADAQGIYPHNQWLQLWLETGAVGVALALTLALVVLARTAKSLAPEFQPFAYAAFASTLAISMANFEITTDSWWAALVASAYLFAALGCPAAERTSARLPAAGAAQRPATAAPDVRLG